MSNCSIKVKNEIFEDILGELVKQAPNMKYKKARELANKIVEEVYDVTTYNATNDTSNTNSSTLIEVSADMINNPQKHNEIFNKLLELDSVKISKEHEDLLRSTMKNLTNELNKNIPDMVQVISKADKNFGSMVMEDTDTKKKGIYVDVSNGALIAGNTMSAAEMYVHELGHAAREFAITNAPDKVRESIIDIQEIYEAFLKEVKYTDFMPETSINLVTEQKIAKDLVEYLKNPRVGINEFMARAETDIRVKNILENRVKIKREKYTGNTLYTKLIALIKNLYEVTREKIRGNRKEETGAEAMARYLQEITKINNIAYKDLEFKTGISKYASNKLEQANEYLSVKIQKQVDKIKANIGTEANKKYREDLNRLDDENLSKYEKTKIYTKIFAKWLVSDDEGTVGDFETFMREIPGKLLKGFGIEGLKGSGDIQQIIRGFRQSDDHEYNIEKLGVVTNKIDHAIDTATMIMSDTIKEILPLTDNESVDITKGLVDIEFESLLDEDLPKINESNFETLVKVLEDEDYLETQIYLTQSQLEDNLGKGPKTQGMINQAKGLGKYMVTGEASIGQLPNSYMIYGKNFSDKFDDIKLANSLPIAKYNTVLIDKLATLYAIKENDNTLNNRVVKIIKDKEKEMYLLSRYSKMIDAEHRHIEQFEGQYDINKVKGHHQKINAAYITYRVGRDDEETAEKMLLSSYKKIKVSDNTYNTLTHDSNFTVYVNDSYAEPGWKAGAVKTTNDTVAINSYTNILKNEMLEDKDLFDKKKHDAVRKETNLIMTLKEHEVKAEMLNMQNEDYVPENTGIMPVWSIDHKGTVYVSDMNITVSKNELENVLRTKNKVETVYAKSYARAADIRLSKEVNLQVLDEVEINAERNYQYGKRVGKYDRMEYVLIGPYEQNDKSIEVWNPMPRYFKVDIIRRHHNRIQKEIARIVKDKVIKTDKIVDLEIELKEEYSKIDPDITKLLEITSKLNNEYIEEYRKSKDLSEDIKAQVKELYKRHPAMPVRENQVYHVFGNREATLFGRDTQNKLAAKYPKAAQVIRLLDMLWKHMVKTLKPVLVVRSIHVLYFNILSNMLLAVLQGRSPIDEIKDQIKGMRYLDSYLKTEEELKKIKVKEKAGTVTSKELNRKKELLNDLHKNPVKPLIEAGMYTSTTEDIANADLHRETYIDSRIEKLTTKVPDKVKKVLGYLYITKETDMYKGLLKTMQYSDFGARYSTYYNLKHKGVPHRIAVKQILDNQINYNVKQGKGMQWLEDRGFMMFTKFLLRIQKVLSRITLKNPLNIGLAVITGGTLYEDSPLGDSMLTRDLMSSAHTPTDLLGMTLDTIVNPALFHNIEQLSK